MKDWLVEDLHEDLNEEFLSHDQLFFEEDWI